MIPFVIGANHGVPKTPSPKDPFTQGYSISPFIYGQKYKMTANKIVSKRYDGGLSHSQTFTYFYNYSEDGLTVFFHNGDYKPIITYTFYPNGELKCHKESSSNTEETYTYTYTEDGKLLSSETPFRKTECYYTNTGVDSMVNWIYSDRFDKFIKSEKYIVTDNSLGYKYERYIYDIEDNTFKKGEEELYEFDKQNRLTKIFRKNEEWNKLILKEEWIYNKNQIEEYKYNDNGGFSSKTKYKYDDNNDLIEEAHFFWGSNIWNTYWIEIYSYSYNEDTSSENIAYTNGCQIYKSSGNIIVTNAKHGERINIYDISGHLHYSAATKSEREEISLFTNQIYIVQVGNKRCKLKL